MFIMHFVAQSVGKSGCVVAKPYMFMYIEFYFCTDLFYASMASIVWNLRVRCTLCMRWLHLSTCCG